jgi:hypothetical protein
MSPPQIAITVSGGSHMITLSATCQANLAPDRRLERQLARAAFEVRIYTAIALA